MKALNALLIAALLGGTTPALADVVVGFSPGSLGGQRTAESVVLDSIASAHRSIHVAIFHFNSKAIAEALVEAAHRGVQVEAVLDKANGGDGDGDGAKVKTQATFLAQQGIPVRIDARYTVMHDKFMVIDGSSVQTGSFNYTNGAAQSHAENALWIRGDAGVTSQFEQEWERLWAESDSYNG